MRTLVGTPDPEPEPTPATNWILTYTDGATYTSSNVWSQWIWTWTVVS